MKNKSIALEHINHSFGVDMYSPNKYIVVQPYFLGLSMPKTKVKKKRFYGNFIQVLLAILEGLFILVVVVVMVVASALFFVILGGLVLKLLLMIFG